MTSKIGTKILPTNTSSTSSTVLGLFKNNPETYFTQAEMVQEFKKSNPPWVFSKILTSQFSLMSGLLFISFANLYPSVL